MGNRYSYCYSVIFLVILFAFLVPLNSYAEVGKVTLGWDPINDPEVGGYTVLWGQASRAYTGSQNFGIVPEVTISLEAGQTYFMAVRGFDKQGVPGELSAEVSTLVKAPDTVAPVISGVSVTSITSTSAVIAFSTNEDAYVQAEYGANGALSNLTGLTNISAKTHAISLTNLSSKTTYSYRVTAKDPSGNQSQSQVLTFQTTEANGNPNEDPNAPIKFLQITLSNVSNTSVTINWTTDKVTTGLVEYGPGFSFSFNGTEVVNTTNHITYLNSLTPSTLYRYRLTAIDSENHQVTSGALMFKTSDALSQPAHPSSQAIFIPSIIENAKFRTNLGINNFSKIIANVSLTLVDIEGLVLGSQTIQVEPEGLKQLNSVARILFADSMGADIQGILYLESDQSVSAWASQIDNSTNDPSLLLSKKSGSTKILIPSSANISTFSSSLVIMNVGFSPAQVAIKVYSTSGELLGQTSNALNIAPSGVLSFENVLETLGVTDNYGPIEITSLNNMPLIASSRVSSTNRAGGFFEGLKYSDASMTQTIANVVDNSEIRTNLGINSVTDSVTTVIIRLFDRNGTELASLPVTVAPKGLTQINNIVREMLNRQDVTNTEGSIRLEANQPIFGWASQIDNSTNDPGFAVSKGQGATRLLVQSTANVGSFRSSLVVLNTGSVDALVDIVSRDAGGVIKGQSRGIVIPAGGFFSTANILETLGVSSNFGPVEVISTNGQPLMATSRVYSTSGTSGFFEGQPIQ